MNRNIGHIGHIGLISLIGLIGLIGPIALISSCTPEPPLHLYEAPDLEVEVSVVDLNVEGYWQTLLDLNTKFDLETKWYYGWDDMDVRTFGEIGYTIPNVFHIRRYFTGDVPYAPHTGVVQDTIEGHHYQGFFDFGYWDMLLWNKIKTRDGVQNIIIDESASLDSVIAYTNQTMHTSRYNAPKYTHSFNEPEVLFAVYEQAIEINKDLNGFVYDEERDVWVRTLQLVLRPVTFIYLTQVILHNNKGRISSVDGNADLSGMARSTNLNTGCAGSDAITVYFNVLMKKDCDMNGEKVDIIGGRLLSFGIPGIEANGLSRAGDVEDDHRHYMDFTMQFNNGMDSTFVFDVTNQIRKNYRGGIITIELDVDTIPIPSRSGGSGFDAVVKDTEDGGTYEFEM